MDGTGGRVAFQAPQGAENCGGSYRPQGGAEQLCLSGHRPPPRRYRGYVRTPLSPTGDS
eukprot:COSAG01_NODE_17_length_39991_cov_30.596160_41_plen_59_part_00